MTDSMTCELRAGSLSTLRTGMSAAVAEALTFLAVTVTLSVDASTSAADTLSDQDASAVGRFDQPP